MRRARSVSGLGGRTAFCVAAIFWLAPGRGAGAQSFGRWWWDAAVAAGLRTNDNYAGSTTVGSFEQRDLRLGIGINGFVLHPAIAQFRLGASLVTTSIGGVTGFDTKRTGYEGNLSILPSGKRPVTLFGQRGDFDYSSLTAASPFSLLRTPDTTSSFGARLRLRTGPLGGTLFGFDSSRVSYAEHGAKDSSQRRHFADWSAVRGRTRRHFRLEGDEQQFGFPDFRFDTLTLTFNQQRSENGYWRWDLNGAAQRREFAYAGTQGQGVDTARLQNGLAKTLAGGRRQLQLNYDGSFYAAHGGGDYQSHALTARHTWSRSARLQVAPYVRMAWQRADAGSFSAAQAGFHATYARSGPNSSLLATSSLAVLEQQGEGASGSALAASFTTALGFGAETGLRREIELAVSRNDVRTGSEPLADLPDLGASLAVLGTEDYRRARASLGRRWRANHATVYGEYTDREASAKTGLRDFQVETLSANLQIGFSRASFAASVGETETSDLRFGLQRIDFASSSASLRLWRNLSVHANYRTDDRRLAQAPSVNSERWEAGADLRLGEFVVRVLTFESRDEIPGFPERSNQGLHATISRSSAGWLPWVTAPKRRGIVR